MYKSLVQYFNILLVFGLAAELFVVEAKSNDGNYFDVTDLKCNFNKEYIDKSDCYIKSYNDTTKVGGGMAVLLKPVQEVRVKFKLFHEIKGQNEMQPIFEITENLCKAEHGSAEIAAAILKMAQSHTNLVKECPLAPKEYYINEVDYNHIARSMLPITVPNGKYKVEAYGLDGTTEVLSVIVLVDIIKNK